MTRRQVSIPEALDTFVHAVGWLRSFTRPCLVERVDGLWVLRDAPAAGARAPSRGPRKTEVIAHDLAPAEVVGRVRSAGIGWHFLCHVHEPAAAFAQLRAAYKALGYRALATEWLFVHDLSRFPDHASEPPARRVRDAEDAERIRLAANRRRQIRLDDLAAEPAPQRLYAAMDERGVRGWVSSVPVGRRGWVTNLYVPAAHRGRGFGRALMSALLRDDRDHGLHASVLLASSDGARLYPHLGYRQIGVLQMFAPLRRPE